MTTVPPSSGESVTLHEEPVSCTVASGDTLWGIALTYGVALEDLLAANPGIKNPNFIHVGDQVVIPADYGTDYLGWKKLPSACPVELVSHLYRRCPL